MAQTDHFAEAVRAIRAASALTEATFLPVGQTLEESIVILAKLTSSSEAVLEDLEGAKLGQALKALSDTAARVKELGQSQARESARFEQIRCLTESTWRRISQMKTSLKDVEALAMNSKIAAANIRASGVDFTNFAAEIGSMLDLTRITLDRFQVELLTVRRHVAAAHTEQVSFETFQREAARSITERLSATVKSIALQHQRATRASLEVKRGSERVRQRICSAILALQIGDITRQRLEHADSALGLVAETGGQRTGTGSHPVTDHPILDADEQVAFIMAAHRLQSAQLSDAAQNFDRDVRQITESLSSLAAEAQALRSVGDSTYGSADRSRGTFIMQLEGQIGEALGLFEAFETARAEVAKVTATVSSATASLCSLLRTVQLLEDDIRIMGLNTTFKCARIGREGLALSVIAQELRSYADLFAKDADALMGEVESAAGIGSSLIGGTVATGAPVAAEATQAMRDSLTTLRQMGQTLDAAMLDLAHDSDRVVALLVATVENLEARNEIGRGLRDAAEDLAALAPPGHGDNADLSPRVEQMLEVMERGYTMANERTVHDRILGRSTRAAPAPDVALQSELEDFLF